ncbi:MAG: type II toxin-antitoxin system VapC family toxin [Kiritimatiellia bacterium]
MRILFDTHTLIWFLSDSPHLTPQARGLLSREGVEIFFSPISIEEIAIKHSLKPEVMPCEPSEVLADALASGLREIPFDAQAAVAVGALPWIHRDPFDRMLIAQAQTASMKLLSHDANVLRYGDVAIGF